jgi:hypothetical protein
MSEKRSVFPVIMIIMMMMMRTEYSWMTSDAPLVMRGLRLANMCRMRPFDIC